MAVNKFFNEVKYIFGLKPVRIVLALIVIASIMTGVAFGVIALYRALNKPSLPPCPKGQVRYDGKNGLPDYGGICLTKCNKGTKAYPVYDANKNITDINCLTSCSEDEISCPYYTDSYGSIKSIMCVKCMPNESYDEQTCSCKPTNCPKQNDSIYYTEPYHIGNGDWVCAQPCPGTNTPCHKKGSDREFCHKKENSFESRFESTTECAKLLPGYLSNSEPEYCTSNLEDSHYLVCEDSKNCKTTNGNYCDEYFLCSKDELHICTSDSECDTHRGVSCVELKSITDKNFTKYKTPLLEKKLDNLKICYMSGSKPEEIPQKNTTCCNYTNIGEQNNSQYSCCPANETGINADIQCDTDYKCTTSALCSNGWQVSDDENQCYNGTETITNSFLEDNGYCCKSGHAIGGMGLNNKGCCLYPVQILPKTSGGNKQNVCMNTTPNNLNDMKNRYSDLGGQQVKCSKDSDCENLNHSLQEQINNHSKDTNSAYYKMSNSISEAEYTKFSCGTKKFIQSGDEYKVDPSGSSGSKYCQLDAGYLGKKVKGNLPFNFNIDNKGYSTAWSNGLYPWKLDGSGPTYITPYDSITGISACVNTADLDRINNGSDLEKVDFYWRPSASNPKEQYYAKTKYKFTNEFSDQSFDEYQCEYALRDLPGLVNILETTKSTSSTAECDVQQSCNNKDFKHKLIKSVGQDTNEVAFTEITASDFENTVAKISTTVFKNITDSEACKNKSKSLKLYSFPEAISQSIITECEIPINEIYGTPTGNYCNDKKTSKNYSVDKNYSLDINGKQNNSYPKSYIQTIHLNENNCHDSSFNFISNAPQIFYDGKLGIKYNGSNIVYPRSASGFFDDKCNVDTPNISDATTGAYKCSK